MSTSHSNKSTVEEIRQRFDNDVERFSNLETGQSATVDAQLAMELITKAAVASTDPIRRVLDIGCGAGNNTIKLRQLIDNDFDVDLVDLSDPMLQRAGQRIREVNRGNYRLIRDDFRIVDLPDNAYDVVLAAAVLHHLRDDDDWLTTFEKLFRIVAPEGSLWITDLVSHESQPVQKLMWDRYAQYLEKFKPGDSGGEYRDQVFQYIEQEDSPRPVTYQLDLLRRVGFSQVELLHKNSCFAAFGAIKAGR